MVVVVVQCQSPLEKKDERFPIYFKEHAERVEHVSFPRTLVVLKFKVQNHKL